MSLPGQLDFFDALHCVKKKMLRVNFQNHDFLTTPPLMDVCVYEVFDVKDCTRVASMKLITIFDRLIFLPCKDLLLTFQFMLALLLEGGGLFTWIFGPSLNMCSF